MKWLKIEIMAFALMPLGLFAQNTLTIHQKDGQQFCFGFEEKPVVTFTDNELVVKSTKTELCYELLLLAEITFDTVDTAVEDIKSGSIKAGITLDEYTVNISGAKADVTVHLIASDGRQLKSYKTDRNGSVTFSISELPEGTYIIASESLTVKIIKK